MVNNDEIKVLTPEISEVIYKYCNGDEIKDFLREVKAKNPDQKVRISSDSKKELIEDNLREAVSDKLVSMDEVYDLIRECEEGQSHYSRFFLILRFISG